MEFTAKGPVIDALLRTFGLPADEWRFFAKECPPTLTPEFVAVLTEIDGDTGNGFTREDIAKFLNKNGGFQGLTRFYPYDFSYDGHSSEIVVESPQPKLKGDYSISDPAVKRMLNSIGLSASWIAEVGAQITFVDPQALPRPAIVIIEDTHTTGRGNLLFRSAIDRLLMGQSVLYSFFESATGPVIVDAEGTWDHMTKMMEVMTDEFCRHVLFGGVITGSTSLEFKAMALCAIPSAERKNLGTVAQGAETLARRPNLRTQLDRIFPQVTASVAWGARIQMINLESFIPTDAGVLEWGIGAPFIDSSSYEEFFRAFDHARSRPDFTISKFNLEPEAVRGHQLMTSRTQRWVTNVTSFLWDLESPLRDEPSPVILVRGCAMHMSLFVEELRQFFPIISLQPREDVLEEE